MAGLRFVDVASGYGSARVLEHLSLEVAAGELVALLGPNGAGKSTLLSLAGGTLRPLAGRIELDGCDLHGIPARQRARRLALVPQGLHIPFAFTVRELVGLGRTPYVHPLRGERRRDRDAVAHALALTDTAGFADRSMLELSGGERQRVLLALALAQEPKLLLLDEPTANLDIAHQLAILELVRELNRARGLTVLAAIHDLNLAALCFDRLLVLDRGRIIADGPPGTVLRSDLIAAVYGSPVRVIDHPTEPVPLVALTRNGRNRPS